MSKRKVFNNKNENRTISLTTRALFDQHHTTQWTDNPVPVPADEYFSPYNLYRSLLCSDCDSVPFLLYRSTVSYSPCTQSKL